MSEHQAQPCGSCQGRGGTVIDSSSNGVTRQTWQSCGTCQGRGTTGGDR